MQWRLVFLIAAVAYLLLRAAGSFFAPYDDTDPPGGRSGLVLYTDHLTGCQYLARPFSGALTPRLDGRGRHLGCKDGGA